MNGLMVVDADAHVTETAEDLRPYLKEEHRQRPIWMGGGDAWDRFLGGTLGKGNNDDPHVQITDMEADGVDVQVIYPTRGLGLNRHKETAVAVDVAHAYNEWLAEFCATDPRRLKGAALVALQDVGAAVKEVRHAVEDLGMVGVMMPPNVRDTDIGRREFWPFYEEVERLGVGLGIHGGVGDDRMHGRFDTFIAVHTVCFPLECMAALTGLVFAGVPEVFPKLRMAALEGNCGWMPFLMDRMDEEFELRGAREAPLLKAKPSEYLLSSRIYCAFELEETTIPYVIERFGVEKLLYSSDYPHWDSAWPNTVSTFMAREDISEAHKRVIMSQNAPRFYGFKAEP